MSTFLNNGRASAANGPINALRPVVPNDQADLPDGVTRGLFVGVAGEIALTDASGGTVQFSSGAMQYHPIAVRRILASGTTADRIFALY